MCLNGFEISSAFYIIKPSVLVLYSLTLISYNFCLLHLFVMVSLVHIPATGVAHLNTQLLCLLQTAEPNLISFIISVSVFSRTRTLLCLGHIKIQGIEAF